MHLERRGQESLDPFVHLPCEDWVLMHWQPHILPIGPHMICQADRHRWGARRAALSQAFMRHHEIVEAD
jgi:hypothetical protein